MPRRNLKDHQTPNINYKFAQLTSWDLLNPTATFGRHDNHDHVIASSSSPTLTVPMPTPNSYSVYAYVVTPLYDAAAAQSGSINAGPACWKQSQKNFQKSYSKKYINKSLAGSDAFSVQHPLGAAIIDPCCNTLQKAYYWHIRALPPVVPLKKF